MKVPSNLKEHFERIHYYIKKCLKCSNGSKHVPCHFSSTQSLSCCASWPCPFWCHPGASRRVVATFWQRNGFLKKFYVYGMGHLWSCPSIFINSKHGYKAYIKNVLIRQDVPFNIIIKSRPKHSHSCHCMIHFIFQLDE